MACIYDILMPPQKMFFSVCAPFRMNPRIGADEIMKRPFSFVFVKL